MVRPLKTQPLEAKAFAPFGQVLEAGGDPDKLINEGRCGRFHDLAQLDITRGKAGISLFHSQLIRLPFELTLVERHPLGSQAFIPMCQGAYLVVVAPNKKGVPGLPLAFLAGAGQGVNIAKGVWHGVLSPLAGSGVFAVVDRIGTGTNLDEHVFETPYTVLPN